MSLNPDSARKDMLLWPLAVVLALMTLAAYWPATTCSFVNFDDNLYVTSNSQVQHGVSLGGLKWDFSHAVASNWHPLTMLSHQIDCQLFGLHPWGHHLTSVLLHAFNAVLVFRLLQILTGAVGRSFFVAVLFAVHPLHVESVAWIAERKDVLSGFFGLLALMFYVCYAKEVAGRSSGSPLPQGTRFSRYSSSAYILALFFFALGLMSKAMLVTWPFVMLLLDYWPLARGRTARAWGLVREKIPFFALAGLICLVTLMTQQHAGAVAAVASLPFPARIANACVSYYRYVGKLLWPTHLAIFYPLPRHWPLFKVAVALALVIGLSLLLVSQRRHRPYLLMGWLWFLGTLVPVIGLIQVGEQSMADRYAYIPSLGVFILLVWGAADVTSRWQFQFPAMALAGAAAGLACLVLTWQQLACWQDSETLFRHDLNIAGDSRLARNNLGAALEEKGETDAAISEYRHALLLQPNDPAAHYNLGNALFHQTNFDAAIGEYQLAIHCQPDYADALKNLGSAYYKQGQMDKAINQFETVIRLQPGDPVAHYNLGKAFFQTGETNRAITEYQSAIALDPSYAQAHNNLGLALQSRGDLDGAVQEFRTAIRLQSGYTLARNNLAAALAAKGSPATP